MPTAANKIAMEVNIATMATEMTQMKLDIREIKADMKGQYVTQVEIKFLKAIVYGAAGSVGLGFMGAVTAFFLRGTP